MADILTINIETHVARHVQYSLPLIMYLCHVLSLTHHTTLFSYILWQVFHFIYLLSSIPISFLQLLSISLYAQLIMNRKPKLAKEVPLCTLWNATRWPWMKKKKNLATNEVLSEINNAVCIVLKDFSKGGVFLYGSQQKCGWDWGVGAGGFWFRGLPCWANCANNSSLTSQL